MKKNIITLMVILMLFWGSAASAVSPKVPIVSLTDKESAMSVILIERLEAIKEIDKSSLSHAEKKTLRKEVKAIDRQLKELNGGVYLSVGAIIIILLLVIILL